MVYGLTLRNIMCSYLKFELRIIFGFFDLVWIKGRANYLQSKSSALLSHVNMCCVLPTKEGN